MKINNRNSLNKMPRNNEKKEYQKRPTEPMKVSGLRMPPQNVEAERSILGAILIDKDAIIKMADMIHADDFYDNRHGLIYAAMANLFEKRMPIDIVTLSEILEAAGQIAEVGGSGYLAEIVNSTPSAANVVYYSQIVREKAILRRLVSAGGDITEYGYDEEGNVSETLDKAEQRLFSVSQNSQKNKFTAIKDVLTDAFDRIDKIHKDKDKGALRGVSSGFRDLDAVTAGFNASDLLILAARPAMGKTSFALNLAENAAIDEKIPVAVFSLEMSKDQLVDRLLSSQSGVDSWKLRTGNLSDDDFPKIGYAMGVLSEAPIFIDDTPSANVMEVRAKARRLQMEHGLGLIIIDYLQLMSGHSRGSDGNRVQEISEISRGLKGLARELNIPIIALSQLSRAVEHRDDKRPQLSDLRESGSIEQDADMVMFLYRDEYYNPETDRKGITEVLIRKHRHGPTGTIELHFNPAQMRFSDLEKRREAPQGE
jgi:replicative DNA helicase